MTMKKLKKGLKRKLKMLRLQCALHTLPAAETKEIRACFRENPLTYFNYAWFRDANPAFSLEYDAAHEMFYTLVEGYKMYFQKGWDEKKCRGYFSFLLKEQLPQSPHFYFDEQVMAGQYDTLVDGGGAEGYFTLKMLGHFRKAYIYECDPAWAEALRVTFADMGDKVCIVERFLSDKDDAETVTVQGSTEGGIDLIKLDVEGADLAALRGSMPVLKPGAIGLVCAYHYQNEEKELRAYLAQNGCEVTNRKGFMYFCDDKTQAWPYWRRGVLRFKKG